MAKYHNHPKVNLIIGDGFEFLKNSSKEKKYDVIITDSSDPDDGPPKNFSNQLFQIIIECIE